MDIGVLKKMTIIFMVLVFGQTVEAQTLPDSIFVNIPGGSFTMGELESEYQGPPNSFDAPEHQVTVSDFRMSVTEITNELYLDFLNSAYTEGLLKVELSNNAGPDMGFTLIYGSDTAPEIYRNQAIYNLSGTRVMKDHDDADGDGDPFTGVIEPENPLNIAFIGFNEENADGEKFYLKDPRNSSDFDWQTLTNYYNYTSNSRQEDTSVLLNDYSSWPQLEDYPNNLPTLKEIKSWPATFIRWYGAKAFAMYYSVDLPTEAQWEYAAKAGNEFTYATSDGNVAEDGSSANWNYASENPALHHVYNVKLNEPNSFGVYNLAGNVWEWCEDWYSKDFYTSNVNDPVNLDSSSNKKVRRGGSWNYHKSTLKSAARASDEQFKGNDHFGFRIVENTQSTNRVEEQYETPIEFKLEQNYPNPFNPSTHISFSIPTTSFVKLEIVNALGQKVATLVNENKTYGNYTVNFDASHLTSGVYLYIITTGDFTQTKKMLLIK